MTNTTVELPEHLTMTVRVVDRGASRSYEGVKIRTVTIQNRCRQCAGPRGEAKPHRFCEDGEWYTCDRWDNPCGHIDMYAAVLAEAKQLIEDSTPRFATCDPDPGMNLHQLGRAFGHEWCECEHTCIINYRNNRGGPRLDEGEPPAWWHDALVHAHTGSALPPDTVADGIAHTWEQLVRLHDNIACEQSTWDRWDEFDSYWGTENRLKYLQDVGIAQFTVAEWNYRDGKGTWHGDGCGCTEINLELLTEQKASV